MATSAYRSLPALHTLLSMPEGQRLAASYSLKQLKQTLRSLLDEERLIIRRRPDHLPEVAALFVRAEALLLAQLQGGLRRVINATGILLHTNLGRAPLSKAAQQAITEVASGYSNLEYHLQEGVRGSRHGYVAGQLAELVGSEAALVTNNNAAAMLLTLSTLASGGEVIISRGQLVEIGGGFRIPDVLTQSGCRLTEVGTTNKTRLRDYEAALNEHTVALLVVHPSNFKIVGFTEEVPLHELAALAHRHQLPLIHDLGSGSLLDTQPYLGVHEPTVQESLSAGADLVCFSGDKLLGGPQAGLIVGRQALISQLSKHPLMRAMRLDKLSLAALEATLRHYQRGEALTALPLWRMLSLDQESIRARSQVWAKTLQAAGIQTMSIVEQAAVGGGSLPGAFFSSAPLAYSRERGQHSLADIAASLRQASPPIIGRIADERLLLDPRTVFPEDDAILLETLLQCFPVP